MDILVQCSLRTLRLDNIPEPARRIKEEEVKLDAIEFSKEDVIKLVKKLQVDKSPGMDGIHPKLLYEARIEIEEALENLFKKSINSGELLRDWKDAVVVPLFKKDAEDHLVTRPPANYRPVSLISIICKVIERMINECMSKFFLRGIR